MNKTNLNKEIQMLVNRTFFLNTVESRIAKKLNNALINFSEMDDKVLEKKKELNLNKMSNDYTETIDVLDGCEENQNIQLIHLKRELKTMEKKNAFFENILSTDNVICETDRQNAFKRSLCLVLLKISTGIFIDQNTPTNIVRGFSTVKNPQFSMKSFEFNLSNEITEFECIDKIWILIKSFSYYLGDWEKLFLSS